MYDVPIGKLAWEHTCKFGGGAIKAHLRQLTTEEEDSCIEYTAKGNVRFNKSQCVRLGCTSIEGLSVGGKAITNGVELCAATGLYALFAELFIEIQTAGALTEGEIKN
jgi:hypothetical protein